MVQIRNSKAPEADNYVRLAKVFHLVAEEIHVP
jgi:hypothetical protein